MGAHYARPLFGPHLKHFQVVQAMHALLINADSLTARQDVDTLVIAPTVGMGLLANPPRTTQFVQLRRNQYLPNRLALPFMARFHSPIPNLAEFSLSN